MGDFVIDNGILRKYCGTGDNVIIPNGVEEIDEYAFSNCKSVTRVTIPDSVSIIGPCAFADCTSLESVTIPDSVHTLNFGIFMGCTNLAEVVVYPRAEMDYVHEEWLCLLEECKKCAVKTYPKLSLTVISEPHIMQMLALGYCTNSELYTEPWAEEYQRYVISERTKLLKRAKYLGLTKAIRFIEKIGTEGDGRREEKRKKLSAQAKVELLEKTVSEEGVDELRTVIERESPFEFTARALGYACAFGGIDKVKILIEAGIDFAFEPSAILKRKYNVTRLDYWMNMARGNLCRSQQEIVCMAMGGGSRKQLLPELERTRIALYLLEQNTAGFNAEKLLFYAILWGSFTLADALQNAGVGLTMHVKGLSQPISVCIGFEQENFDIAVINMSANNGIKVLTRMQDILDKDEEKLVISKSLIEAWIKKPKCFNGNILRFIAERTDISKISKMGLMTEILDQERIDLLETCAECQP